MVRFFVRSAIAPSTRRTYSAPTARYADWCLKRGYSALAQDLTPMRAASWLAFLGQQGELHTSTIKVYRSALSTWWREERLAEGVNPVQSGVVELVILGIAREHRQREVAARALRPVPLVLTPTLIRELHSHAIALSSSPEQLLMLWTALHTGTYGLLRPSEMLGSQAHPSRALTASQIEFYRDRGSDTPYEVASSRSPADLDSLTSPDRFTISLGPTKTDQLGHNPPLPIAAAPAVRAMWQWMHMRSRLGLRDADPLFALPGQPPLSCRALLTHIDSWIAASGRVNARVSGKSFRRGGASALMAAGASTSDVATAGRWKTQHMAERYTSDASQLARATEVSRSMAPR